jgi:hypothetical protein
MSRGHFATGLAALALTAAPAAMAAPGPPNHSKLFNNKAGTVTCGLEIALPHKPHQVLCSATGIPRAKTGVGDPFVQIARTGKPHLVLVSQNEYQTNTAVKLGTGSSWQRTGVICTVAGKSVTCTNTSSHGFTIGNGKYKAF